VEMSPWPISADVASGTQLTWSDSKSSSAADASAVREIDVMDAVGDAGRGLDTQERVKGRAQRSFLGLAGGGVGGSRRGSILRRYLPAQVSVMNRCRHSAGPPVLTGDAPRGGVRISGCSRWRPRAVRRLQPDVEPLVSYAASHCHGPAHAASMQSATGAQGAAVMSAIRSAISADARPPDTSPIA